MQSNMDNGTWAKVTSLMAALIFVKSMGNILPSDLVAYVQESCVRLFGSLSPYITMKIEETSSDRFGQSELFIAVHQYLSDMSSAAAKTMFLSKPRNSRGFSFSADRNEPLVDHFQGAKLYWVLRVSERSGNRILFGNAPEERRFYELSFHGSYKRLVLEEYLAHILSQAKAVQRKRRQRKIYTNCVSDGSFSRDEDYNSAWVPVAFDHPSTFETLALDPKRKANIIADLDRFRNAEQYHRKVGRAWKRGYLLYGPPGTGKSSMIAAISNYLEYDVYDLELTQVRNNSDLLKLLMSTSNKSVIVIEDIDCSLDLTDRRKKPNKVVAAMEKAAAAAAGVENDKEEKKKEERSVTLSGLLNFTDGLWSCCGSERIFVFTTNYVERIDPALLRSGRMDMHIELSYCSFEAFKVLAANYLETHDHHLFPTIEAAIGDARITPADVAEHFMRRSNDPDGALTTLLEVLIDRRNAPSVEPSNETRDLRAAADKESVAQTSG